MSGRPRSVNRLLSAAAQSNTNAAAAKAFPTPKPVVVPGATRSSFAATYAAPKPPSITFDTMAQRHTNAG